MGVHPTVAVDPTGAGDTFAAAFLLSLARGDGIGHSARLASAAASIVIEGEGGTELRRLGESGRRADRVPLAGSQCRQRSA
jgi:sugar/nucleoside kinase (ribokinase family)